jgi:hypothetical protein
MAVETAFRVCCQQFSSNIVGVWGGWPISYPLLAAPSPLPAISDALMRELGWDRFITLRDAQAGLETLERRGDDIRHQQLAYAGWLTFNHNYQHEKGGLQQRWTNLGVPLPWPLRASTADREPQSVASGEVSVSQILPRDAVTFLEEVSRFLRKWNVVQLVTWDLPLPQGPLAFISTGLARNLCGPDQVISVFPNYYDIPSRQVVRADIREQQEYAARAAGIGDDFPRNNLSPRASRSSELESSFRLWFFERAALQRYRGRRGLTSRLVESFSRLLGCSIDRVNQLRRIAAPFRSIPTI